MESAPTAQKALEAGQEAVTLAPWSRNLLVRTPYGWGKIRHVRGSGSGEELSLVVKLDWHGILYTRPSELREMSRAPLGACVDTSMGPGVLVDFRRKDRVHVVRLWNRIGCDGTALAFLQPSSIFSVIKGSPGMEAVTGMGAGQVVAYLPCRSHWRQEEQYLITLDPTKPPTTFSPSDVDCPGSRVQPLLESLVGKLQRLWRGQLVGQVGRVKLSISESREKLCLAFEGEDGKLQCTEVSANTRQLSDMLEGQGQRAVEGVREWLREERASDWLEGGRSRLYTLLNAPQEGHTEEKKESQVSFWDLPSLLGVSSAFNLHGSADLKEAWESARLHELLSMQGPWAQLGRVIEDDDRLDDIISEVKREWRLLERMREQFRETKTIKTLLQGMTDLIGRFQTLADAPEFAFLRKRGVFFMNQFLHPSAPTVTKAKRLVDAAQGRVEAHLNSPSPSPSSSPPTPTPLSSLASSLGLTILVDVEASVLRHVSLLSALLSAVDSLRSQGFSVMGLNRLEGALLLLYDLLEDSAARAPPNPSPAQTKTQEEVRLVLRDVGAPSAVHDVAVRFAQGHVSLHEGARLILELLEKEDMVTVAGDLISHGQALLARLETFRSSPAFRAFLLSLSDSSLEERLFANLEAWDPEDVVREAEAAFSDGSARQRLLSQLTDSCLDFLLDYLPSMPIPPITGLKDNVEYTISHLDMSGFKLNKEDVEVVLGEGQETEVLVVHVQHIAALFKSLQWAYKQNYFPFMQGDGVADASVVDGAIRLGFRLKRRQVPSPPLPSSPPPAPSSHPPPAPSMIDEPVVVLSSKHVSMSTLSLRVDGCAMAWLYNLLAGLFAEGIREYIVRTLHDTLSDNMTDLLTALNHYARSAWPLLSRLTGLELTALPLLTPEEEAELSSDTARRDAGKDAATEAALLTSQPLLPPSEPLDLDVVIHSQRHLGMHVDVSEADNRVIVRGVSPGGDFAKALPVNVRPARLIAAHWTGLNGHSLATLPVSRLIPLLRKLPRPVTLRLRLQPLQGVAPSSSSSSSARAPSPLPYATTTLTFAEPSAGIRFKASPTLPSCLFVCGFPREDANPSALLPAEASGSVTPGQVLVGVNGALVRGLPLPELTALLRSPQRPMTLTFGECPDLEYAFPPNGPMDLCVAAFERDVVVTGFVPQKGPLEATGRCHLGDTLLSVNGVNLPTPAGYLADMDLLRHCTYPAHLTFQRKAARGQKTPERYEVVLPEVKGKWGVVFVRDADERPVIRGWNGLLGPAQSSGVVKPGMAVLKIGQKWVADMVAEGRSVESVAESIRLLRPPVTLTLRAMDVYVKWAGFKG